MSWKPAGGGRVRGHPKMRWTDDVARLCFRSKSTLNWEAVAQDIEEWRKLGEQYANERKINF